MSVKRWWFGRGCNEYGFVGEGLGRATGQDVGSTSVEYLWWFSAVNKEEKSRAAPPPPPPPPLRCGDVDVSPVCDIRGFIWLSEKLVWMGASTSAVRLNTSSGRLADSQLSAHFKSTHIRRAAQHRTDTCLHRYVTGKLYRTLHKMLQTPYAKLASFSLILTSLNLAQRT